jgi:hypothetical protein
MSDTPPGHRWILVVGAVALAALVALLGWFLVERPSGEAPAKVAAPAAPKPPSPPPREDAAAQPALPALAGRILLSGCRQGQCAWVRVVRLETVTVAARGELRRLVGRSGMSLFNDEAPDSYSASVRVRWAAQDRSSYAFCSTARPAYAFPDDEGHLYLHYLDLFDLAGYQTASATMYMRICHDLPSYFEDATALRNLGYHPGTRNEQIEDAAPEDLARF